jgi:NAD(P)-dependent dehydrogenase (short-subunit alcohol dehydrogenase family)
MRSIAATYADQGIRANTIAAGWTATELGPGAPISRDGYRQWKEVAALNRRIADADEVARLALFLASDESSMLNGAVIAADAGWSVR